MSKTIIPLNLCPRGELARSWDARPRYFVEVPPAVAFDDVLNPTFWRDVTRFFKQRYAVVEVVSVSGAWECVLSAVQVLPDDGGVEMRLISEWRAPDEAMPALPEGYETQLHANGWAVFDRNANNRPPVASGVVSERKAHELANADFERRTAFVRGSH
jgi:hypothetical protein